MTIQFKGIQAILILVIAGGLFGFRVVSAKDTLDTEARAELTPWLQARYADDYLSTMDLNNPTPEDAEALLARSQVEIKTISARGRPDDMIIRTEIEVNGQPPPDGTPVRYWEMEYSRITGWHLRRETRALFYYLKVF